MLGSRRAWAGLAFRGEVCVRRCFVHGGRVGVVPMPLVWVRLLLGCLFPWPSMCTRAECRMCFVRKERLCGACCGGLLLVVACPVIVVFFSRGPTLSACAFDNVCFLGRASWQLHAQPPWLQ